MWSVPIRRSWLVHNFFPLSSVDDLAFAVCIIRRNFFLHTVILATFSVICKDEPVIEYKVIYTDGVGGGVFGAESHGKLSAGDKTPGYLGNRPTRDGYTFTGWKLTSVTPNKDGVQEKVSADDANSKGEISKVIRQFPCLLLSVPLKSDGLIVRTAHQRVLGRIAGGSFQRVVRIAERLSKEDNFAGVAVCSADDANSKGEIIYTAQWEEVVNKPTAPTPEDVNRLVKGDLTGAVEVYCQPKRQALPVCEFTLKPLFFFLTSILAVGWTGSSGSGHST